MVVVGTGFGGLGAAVELAERGARLLVFERLDYPGGCAGTFERKGARYDAGATLSSGFARGQLFDRWVERYGLSLQREPLDPVVELRAPGVTLPVCADRAAFVERLCARSRDRAPAIRRFFQLQGEIAATLWQVLDGPEQLPPFGRGGLRAHLGRAGRYLPVARWMGRPLLDVLAHFGLQDHAELRLFCDAVCQITVQCSAAEAEAPFALGTLDYFFRGVTHLRGGIGELARAVAGALDRLGAPVRYLTPVRGLRRDPDAGVWQIDTRRGPVRARAVVANLLPQALLRLCEHAPEGHEDGDESADLGAFEGRPRLEQLAGQVERGWSAAMLYVLARGPAGSPRGAHHLELVGDPSQDLIEGNHLFVSISGEDEPGRAPAGLRAITISTHLPAPKLRALAAQSDGRVGAYVRAVHERMREVLAARAPEWAAGIERITTASPRTFERYTQRPGGLVGGIPRRAGLHNYGGAWPRPIAPGLWLVGDTIFPGQSTLAAALGGLATGRAVAASLELRPPGRAAGAGR